MSKIKQYEDIPECVNCNCLGNMDCGREPEQFRYFKGCELDQNLFCNCCNGTNKWV